MKYLFLILKKQFFFLLFIFLELIAFLLLANYNNYHRSNIINTSNTFTGAMYSGVSSVSDYFMLKKVNRQLIEENARLLGAEKNADIYDSLEVFDSSYLFIPAKVISNTSRNRNNYIMINKGKNDGIDKEMGLISSNGIAGIVVEVTSNYATAMSMLNKNTRVSGRLKKSGQMVNVVWDGIDYKKGIVEDIPTHILPQAGDTVITSGYSFVFPENIMIGTIGDKLITGGTLNQAELIFSTDFNNINYVYACKNNAAEEIDSLQIVIDNE